MNTLFVLPAEGFNFQMVFPLVAVLSFFFSLQLIVASKFCVLVNIFYEIRLMLHKTDVC